MKKFDFILEIGTEEIPSGYIEVALENLRASSRKAFEENLLEYNSIETFATPRRLVLFVKGLSDRQFVKKQTKRGPSLEICYDANGKATEKLTGFMKRFNLKKEDLTTIEEKGKKYICGNITEKPKPAGEILQNILPDLILKIDFPKAMLWDSSFIRFARPIRWILALYGNTVIQFNIGNLKSANLTFGHRFLAPGPFKIKDTADYFRLLKKSFVILDAAERKDKILKEVNKKLKGASIKNIKLLDTIKYLVEYPSVFVGEFDKNYIWLSDIIVHTMTKNQKILAVSDKGGKLLPRFIAVTDGKPEKLNTTVKKHYEGILNAKLKDASFFVQEDEKIELETRKELLKKVIFYKGSSYFDKIERIKNLSLFIASELGGRYANLKQDLIKAAGLSKIDLTTSMVREFPDLQGFVGGFYAKSKGYDEKICRAISEHYLPRQAGDELPESELGQILSLADKLDNLVTFFVAGIRATGSEDPYGLRRSANGFIQAWFRLDKDFRLSLDRMLDESIKSLSLSQNHKDSFKYNIESFLCERFYSLFPDIKKEVLDAVLPNKIENLLDERLRKLDNLPDARKRISDINSLLKNPVLEDARVIVERTSNILKQNDKPLPEINTSLFKEDRERALYSVLSKFKNKTSDILPRRDYAQFTEIYAKDFIKPLNSFFDKVRVNVDDQSIRLNRMALVKEINSLYTEKIADLSKLKEVK